MPDTISPADLPIVALAGDDVAHISPNATLLDVADRLADREIGALVVRDGDAVQAVISERDLIRALARRVDPSTTRVIDIASTNVVWCDATATVSEVATEMMDRYVRHVLVEEDGALVGIVSARDLIGAFAADVTE